MGSVRVTLGSPTPGLSTEGSGVLPLPGWSLASESESVRLHITSRRVSLPPVRGLAWRHVVCSSPRVWDRGLRCHMSVLPQAGGRSQLTSCAALSSTPPPDPSSCRTLSRWGAWEERGAGRGLRQGQMQTRSDGPRRSLQQCGSPATLSPPTLVRLAERSPSSAPEANGFLNKAAPSPGL